MAQKSQRCDLDLASGFLRFHCPDPHLHVLAADGLFTPDGRFHCMPAEDLAPAIELYSNKTCGQQPLIPDRIIRPPKSSSSRHPRNNPPATCAPSGAT